MAFRKVPNQNHPRAHSSHPNPWSSRGFNNRRRQVRNPWHSRMESDVEEGEIRESELLSPLSEDEIVGMEDKHRSSTSRRGSRKHYHLSKRESRRRTPSPPPRRFKDANRDGSTRRRKSHVHVSREQEQEEPKKRWKSGESSKSYKSIASDTRSHSPSFNSNHGKRKRNHSSEDLRGGRSATMLTETFSITQTKPYKRHRKQANKSLKDLNCFPSFSTTENRSIEISSPLCRNTSAKESVIVTVDNTQNTFNFNHSTNAQPVPKLPKEVSPPSPIIFEYEPPLSPDDVNAGRSSTLVQPETNEDDNEIEVLSVIDKSTRVAELIVIDSTSSSESDDETDFEDPNSESPKSPSTLSPPEQIPPPDQIPPPKQVGESTTQISSGTIVGPITDEEPTMDENEEDLEVLELRIKALEGLMQKMPTPESSQVAGEEQKSDNPTPTVSDCSQLNKDLNAVQVQCSAEPDDSEKENELELELLLLRNKLLSDLEKKRTKTQETANLQMELEKKRKSNPNSTKQKGESKLSQSKLGKVGSRRRSSDTYRSSSSTSKSHSHSSSRSSYRSHKSPSSSKSNLPSSSPALPSFSVSVSKDGKRRTVLSNEEPTITAPISPITVTFSEETKNLKRIVRVLDNTNNTSITTIKSSPVKPKKMKPVSITKPRAVTIPTSGPQKVLTIKSSIVKINRQNSGPIPAKSCQSKEAYAITRTIVNPSAYKSKYGSKKPYHSLKRTNSGPQKKFKPIVIPLRDNDMSTDDEIEQESQEDVPTTSNNVLPEGFHSSLDKFLKSVRESATLNGLQGNQFLNNQLSSCPIEKSISVPTPIVASSPQPTATPTEVNPVQPIPIHSEVNSQLISIPTEVKLPQTSNLICANNVQEISSATNMESEDSKLREKNASSPVAECLKGDIHSCKPNALPLVQPNPIATTEVATMESDHKQSKLAKKLNPAEIPSERVLSNSPLPVAGSSVSMGSSQRKNSKAMNPGESLAEQVKRTLTEFQMREKLLRATFKKNEMKFKLSKSEQEFLNTRQSATSLLGSAIEKINQHRDKKDQCDKLEKQVEKLRKQLEVAEKSLFVRKSEAARLHGNAVDAIHEAFEMRAKSVDVGVQCMQLGNEVNGEQYKVPTAGASELLAKFLEVYKLATKEDTRKGPVHFKKLENQIMSSFIKNKVVEPESPRSDLPCPKNNTKACESNEKVFGGLTRHANESHDIRWNTEESSLTISATKKFELPYFTAYQSPLFWLQNRESIENCNAIVCKYVHGTCPTPGCKYLHLNGKPKKTVQ